MTAKDKRKRERFEIGKVVPLAGIAVETEEPPEDAPIAPKRKRRTKAKRPSTTKPKRQRPGSRKNYSVDVTTLIEELLSSEAFFQVVELIELPPGLRGPPRQYSPITVLLWESLLEDFDSFHDMEAYCRHPLIWGHIANTLESAWPDDPTRRVPAEHPMSRSQFHRHRRRLRTDFPDAMEECRKLFRSLAHSQARAMAYLGGESSSLAKPHPTDVVSGDGTEIQAATDAVKGDMVVDANGEQQQARYDADAALSRKDPTKEANPAFNIGHLQVSRPGVEQERVILDFCRTNAEGEAKALEAMALALKEREDNFRHYSYDMAVQGATINRLYGSGLMPAVKVPRNSKGEPASALIETRMVGDSRGEQHRVQIFGLDGVVGMTSLANGMELFVPLVPRALREPRTGCIQGFYEFPDHPVVHRDLRGRSVMVRLDGLTDDGRNRPQYIRWLNEHTEIGRATLGLREGTESEHAVIKKMLPWGRARCFSEFNLMFDLLGYFLTRNMRAALAHQRRTGFRPDDLAPVPDPPQAIAA